MQSGRTSVKVSSLFIHSKLCIVCIVWDQFKKYWSYVRREQCVFPVRALLFSALVSRQHISGDKSTWSSVNPVNESSQLTCHCVIGPLCVCTCVCVLQVKCECGRCAAEIPLYLLMSMMKSITKSAVRTATTRIKLHINSLQYCMSLLLLPCNILDNIQDSLH